MKIPLYSRIILKSRQIKNRGKINYSFMSGDSFKNICDLTIEGQRLSDCVNTNNIRTAKVIFCKSDLIEEFIDKYKFEISAQIIICGNSDRDFVSNLEFPNSIKRIFLQNSFISDNEKIYTLPIGLENQKIGVNGLPKNYKFSEIRNPRKHAVLVGPFSHTHVERNELINKYQNISGPWETLNSWVFPDRLVQRYREFSFVLSPRGNGVDTHRVWESIYNGAIPIIQENSWSKSIKQMGFPVALVKDLEPETIRSFIMESEPTKFSPEILEILWMPYWEKLVKSIIV